MAGTLIVSNLTTDTDNTFIVRSNTGTTLFSANTTGIDIANSIGATAITNDKILSVANTKISGNIISSQIAPNQTLNGNVTVGGTGFIQLPSGTTAQRPTAANGQIRFNTSLGSSEIYQAGNWNPFTFFYTINYLVVAGGGGASTDDSNNGTGGGGAGGLLSGSQIVSLGTVFTATVGAGGLAATQASGTASSLTSPAVTLASASGGGHGSKVTTWGAGSGGSGGGGDGYSQYPTGAAGTSGQGNPGGNGAGGGPNRVGGGGGGAGAVGGNNAGTTAGAGGTGLASSITGSSVTYAGGGGGGANAAGTGGAGGPGGGGAGGGNNNSWTAVAGSVNTGGGAGGNGNNGTARAGGSGVIILSIPTVNYSGTTTGTPTVTTSNTNTILTFTASGTYTT